ncbi:hypothetical protein JW813_16770 [Clostridium botulinum]|uniref:Uncharacterized protein n=1 Tax=Clostridium botulinum TaxID=1491 RepID=A0A846K1H1_CLOBO|nr:hypothetical protein [Clostridium botulinum]NFN05150.1 hypothetical protein [Clostridium botulinum]NFN35293.1 hypothetical protein [Clostridium botulinum]UZP03340.1 hypothetical protein JW813_16770 [Clostridium botulinum]UZP06698.1 hypothetical protein JYA71_17040 [Clostridium botulinum]UZP10079.1 hypothetical protein JYA74_16765 [Clostridium botulinum]
MEDEIKELKDQIIQLNQFNQSTIEVLEKLGNRIKELSEEIISIKYNQNNKNASITKKNELDEITDLLFKV